MTVSTTIIKNSYSGDGSQHSFAYGFKIFADADLDVIIRSSTGVETVKVLDTDYVVTNAGNDSGGNVLFKFNTGNTGDAHYSATDKRPQSGETIVIRRSLNKTQSTDYVANDPFPAESHEDALDRLTFISQEIQEETDRSIKLSRTNTMTSTEFTVGATDRANKVLAFDSSGEISVTQELGTFKGTDTTTTTAGYVQRDIIKSTTTAQLDNIYICVADSVVGDLLTDTDHFELLVDAVSAATSATNAANSASAASTSESNAATSASTATTQASNASTSASNAATSATAASNAQTAAETAQTAAEAALDTFDDRFLGAKATDPTVDNDGNALIDGALYFDTTNDIMKVYDLTNTQWRQLTLTSTNQTNVNTVAGQISPTNNIATVAGDTTNIGTIATDLTGSDTIGTVAGSISNLNLISGSISNLNTVASNLASVNNFGEVYRISASAPTTSLDLGDLYFDTTSDTLKVYGASGWQNAGSSINGTSQRYHYDITGTPTSVTGADANGNTLTYDAGYVDVYVNGVRMSQADVTVTSGDTVTFASALSNGDEVDIVGYGTFSVASLNADNLDSGTVPSARVSGAYTGITSVGTLTSFASTGIDDNASSTAITLDANNNLLVGTTDTNVADNTTGSGININGTGEIKVAQNGTLLNLNRLTSDGEVIRIKKDGSTVGSIGTRGGTLEVGSGDVYLQFNGTNDWIKPVDGSGNNKSGVDLGTSGANFDNLYLSGGVYLGGTGSANKLDDYEEGTWTPTMGGTTTYYARTGEYTKVGNMVYVRGQVSINAIGTGSTVQIQGLPFTSKTTVNGNPAGALNITYYSGLAIAVNFIAGHVTSASSNIQIIANAGNNTTVQYNTGNFFGNGTRLDFTMVYQAS